MPDPLLPAVGANGHGEVTSPLSAPSRGRAVVLALLSGLLLTAAFPTLELAPLAWVGLVPVLLATRGRAPGAAFGLGWLAGFTFYVTTCYWIVETIAHYTALPWPVAVVLLGAMSAVLACYHGAFLAGLRWLEARRLPAVWVAAPLWVVLEWLRGWFFIGFPWAGLGYTQYRYLDLVQLAEVTGVYGVSAVLVFANVVIAAVLQERGRHVRRRLPELVALTILVVGLPAAGAVRRHVLAGHAPAGELAVGLAQGNVDQERKWDPAFQDETMRRYRELTLAMAPEARLIVWPETATPFFLQVPGPRRDDLLALAREAATPLLVGSPAFVREAGGAVAQLNRAYLIDPDGHELGTYDKIQLVPFGEYVPFAEVLFFVEQLVQSVGAMAAGETPTVFAVPEGRFGVLICYEGIFPGLTRRFVADGADFLVNVTNDAWYGRTSAPHQHLAQATLRAVENRVPLVRAANTGISAIVEPDGRIRWQGPLYEMLWHVDTIRWPGVRTFYTRFGDVFVWLCVAVTVGALAAGVGRGRPAK